MPIKCLVFSGGNIKGFTYLGIIKFLEEINFEFNLIETYIGTSIGSICVTLLTVGYTFKELKYCVDNLDILKLFQLDSIDLNLFLNKYGFLTSTKIIKLLKLLIDKKTNSIDITFIEHFNLTKKNLIIVGSNVSCNKPTYFSYKSHPNMKIIDAISISINIPIIFQPVIYDNNYYVDGGLYDNFPIYFASKLYKLDEILGFVIYLKSESCISIDNFEDFLINLITSLDVRNKHFIMDCYNDCSIVIQPIKTYLDGLNKDDIIELIDLGYNSIKIYYQKNKYRFNNIKINLKSLDDSFILLKEYNDY